MKTPTTFVKNPELQKRYTGNWVARALFALIDTPQFSPYPADVAETLGASIEEVVHAFETLESLSLIKRTENGYKKYLENVYFSDTDLNPKTILNHHVLISTQIMSRLNISDDDRKKFYRTGFLASNQKLVKNFCTEMERLLMGFIAESQREESDGVYSFSFSKVQITNPKVGTL